MKILPVVALTLVFLLLFYLVLDVKRAEEPEQKKIHVASAATEEGRGHQPLIDKFSADLERLLRLIPEASPEELPACLAEQMVRVSSFLKQGSCLEEALEKVAPVQEDHSLSEEEQLLVRELVRRRRSGLSLSEEESLVLDEVHRVYPHLIERWSEKSDEFEPAEVDADDDDDDDELVLPIGEGEAPERNFIEDDSQRAPTSPLAGEGLPRYPRDWLLPLHDNDAIFVAVVNFRDPQCAANVRDAYANAAEPDRIYFGIAQQNRDSDADCLEMYCVMVGEEACRRNQVRILRLKETEARGVMYARWLASTLWSGERFYLQIDAHSGWSNSWDEIVITQWQQLKEERAILSHHPPDMALHPDGMTGRSINICQYHWDSNRLPRFSSQMVMNSAHDIRKPFPGIFIGAGAVFGRSEWIIDCPFDKHLHYLFSGEELLLGVCLFTKGWQIYNPSQMFVWHWYKRDIKGRPNPSNAVLQQQSVLRIKYQMQVLPKRYLPKKARKNIEPYLMGSARSPRQYFEYAGLDLEKREVKQPFCEVKSKRQRRYHALKVDGLPPLDSYSFDSLELPPKEFLRPPAEVE